MTKAELVDVISSNAGITKAAAGKVLKTFMEEISEGLKRNERITFVGFGSFYVSQRKARKGRNPRTGKAMKIPAASFPKFKACEAFRKVLGKTR